MNYEDWFCRKATPDMEINVIIAAKDENNVTNISASATSMRGQPIHDVAAEFLSELSALPLKGNDAEQARSWTLASVGSRQDAATVIGGLRLMVFEKNVTEWATMLRIMEQTNADGRLP